MNCFDRLRIAVLASWIAGLTVASSWAQRADSNTDTPSKSAQESEKGADALAAERFLQILLRRPRLGATFDRTYAHYADRGALTELTNDLENRFVDSDNGNAATLLGLVSMQQGRYSEASNWLQRAEEKLPQDAIISFYLAQCHLIAGRKADAYIAFERAIEKRPSKADALQILEELGRVYQRDGQPEKALEVWRQLEQMFPGDFQVQQQVAQVLVEEGDIAGAAMRFDRLAELAKSNVLKIEMRWRAAKLRLTLEDPNAALRELEQLVGQINPDSWLHDAIRSDIDNGYLAKRNYDGLVAYYDDWIQQNPDDLDAMLRIAKYLPADEAARAKEWVVRASERAPSATAPLVVLADLLERELDYDGASKVLQRLVAIEPTNADFVQRYGLCVARNQKIDEAARRSQAIEIWRSILTARKRDALTFSRTADLLRGIGAKEEAIELYREAIQLAVEEPQYREYLGEYLYHLGRVDEAMSVWREIASGERSTRDNYLRLSEVFQKHKLFDEALSAMKSACEQRPLFTHRLQYATILCDVKRYKEALEQLDEANKLAITPEEQLRFWNQQIDTLTRMGSLKKSTAEFKKRIESNTSENARELGEEWLRLAMMQELHAPLEAVNSIRRSMKMMPESRIVADTAVRIFENNQLPNESLDALNRLLKIDPRSRVAYLKRIAGLHMAKGDLNAALSVARDLLATSGTNSEHHLLYADICFRLQRNEEGLTALRHNLRMHPNDPLAISALSVRLLALQKDDEAIELAWRALDVSKGKEQTQAALDALAQIYKGRHRTGEFRNRLLTLPSRGFNQREMTMACVWGLRLIGEHRLATEQLATQLVGDARDKELLIELVELSEKAADFVQAFEYQQRLCQVEKSKQADLKLSQLELAAGQTASALERLRNLGGGKVTEVDFAKLIDDLEANKMYLAAASVGQAAVTEFPQDWELLAKSLISNHRVGASELANQYAETILTLNLPYDTPARAGANANVTPIGPINRQSWLERSVNVGDKLDIPIAVLKYGLNQTPREASEQAEVRDWLRRSAGESFEQRLQTARAMQLQYPNPTVDSKISLLCYGDARTIALSLPLIARGLTDEERFNSALTKCEAALATQSSSELWEALMQLRRIGKFSRRPEAGRASRQIINALISIKDCDAIHIALEDMRSRATSAPSMSPFTPSQGLSRLLDSRSVVTLNKIESRRFHDLLEMQAEIEGTVSSDDALVLTIVHFKLGEKRDAMQILDLALKASAPVDSLLSAIPTISSYSHEAATKLLAGAFKGHSESQKRRTLFESTLDDFLSERYGKTSKSETFIKLLVDMIDAQAERNSRFGAPELYHRSVFNRVETNMDDTDSIVDSDFLFSSEVLPTALSMTVRYLNRHAESAKIEDVLAAKSTNSEASMHQLAVTRCCLAYWQWLNNQRDEALATIRSAQTTEIAATTLQLYESQMLFYLRRFNEAFEIASKIESETPEIINERDVVLLNTALNLGKTEQANQVIERLTHPSLELEPQKQIMLARAMLRLGQKEQALVSLCNLRNTNNESLFASLLHVFSRNGFKAESTELSEYILSTLSVSVETPNASSKVVRLPRPSSIAPPNLESQYYIRKQAVAALVETGDIHASIERFEKKLSSSPLSPKINYSLVAMYRAIGNEDRADDIVAEYRGNTTGSPSTLIRIAKEYAASENHALGVKLYLKALRLKPELLNDLNAFRSSIVNFGQLPQFCNGLHALGLENFNKQQFMLFSIGRELLRGNDPATKVTYISDLLDHFGICTIPGLIELNSASREERFSFLDEALADKVASKLVEHCKLEKPPRLETSVDDNNPCGAWEAVFSSLQRFPTARARVLSELLAVDEHQRTAAAQLMLTLSFADVNRDAEAEQQFASILNSPSISSKLGSKAIGELYFLLAKELGKPEMATRVLEHALLKATEADHVELLKKVHDGIGD